MHAYWWPVWPLTLSLLGKSRRSLKWHQTSFEPVQCRWPVGDRRSQVTRIVKPEPVVRSERNLARAPPRLVDRASFPTYRLLRLPSRPVRAAPFLFHLNTTTSKPVGNECFFLPLTLIIENNRGSRILGLGFIEFHALLRRKETRYSSDYF